MTRRSRRALSWLAVILATVLVAVIVTVAWPPPAFVYRPAAIVSMGDSLLSGEGAGDYTFPTDGHGGNWCHRSPHAAVHRVHLEGFQTAVNLACSGAPSAQVAFGVTRQWTEPSQVRQLAALARTHRISAVIVAIGANDDPQLSHLMTSCARSWLLREPPCHLRMEPSWQKRLEDMRPKVVRAIHDIEEVLQAQGFRREDYDLVQLSYPSPLTPTIPEALRDFSGCPFQKADLAWFDDLAVPSLSASLRWTAEQTGARFLDLADAGDGHEACNGGSHPGVEWFTRLTVDWPGLDQDDRARHATQESFHPNATGHAQFARCISQFLATSAPVAACRSGHDNLLDAIPAS